MTHIGTFRYTVRPFGIKTAPSAFHRIIDKVVRSCHGTIAYIYDNLVAAATKDEQAKRAAEVQKRIEQVCLVINWDKSVKEAKSVEWLGHCLSEDGIKPTDKKADQTRAVKTHVFKGTSTRYRYLQLLRKIHKKYGGYRAPHIRTESEP